MSNIVPIEIENIDPGFPPDWLVSGDQVTAPALDEKKEYDIYQSLCLLQESHWS